ncbi:NACHT domain-containing protein [Streptomyces sp. TM32]|uniref:NACHT domain-containing protein n=1 Tax=Streptomyces sp. TM32 TaxID=1652669 RepID=UPI0010139CC9|nr:NACHT domain-containing protein [Streptomyces sp. TM32]RXS81146.1 NACHT domain-containing protein [Streptomyces sp. TM32]
MSDGLGLREPDPAERKAAQSGGDRSVNVGGNNSGIISTGDHTTNTLVVSPVDALAGKARLLADKVGGFLKREEEQQRLWDPKPLPVRCRPAPAALTGRGNSVLDVSARPAATFPLDLTGSLENIAAVYKGKERGRLMVLGRPGSGKTILIRRFARAWLDVRDPTGEAPVPVIFSLGSWNPTTTPLRDWLTDRLERDHPFLAGVGPDRSTWANALIDADRVLAILDGFDEIADGLHQAALRDLRATTVPLLMTSRRDELEAAVGDDPLFAGIELTDLTLDDSAGYLLHDTCTQTSGRAPRNGADTTAPTGWAYVLNQLRRHPYDPACANLAAVLTTPLMVTLAHTVYKSGRDPVKLLEIDEFSTQGALEDHLLDNFVPTAYDRFLSNRPVGKRRPWDTERASHWLGHLATHLKKLDTHDIEWWRLGTAMSLPSRMLVSGVTSGLVLGTIVGLVDLMGGSRVAFLEILMNATGIGLALGLLHGFASNLTAGGAFEPSRMHIRIRGGTRRVKESFLPRVRGGLAGGLVFGFVYGLETAVLAGLLAYPWTAMALQFANWLAAGLILGLAAGLILALMAGLEAVIETKSSVSPWDLLNTNRTTVLAQVLAVGLVLGLGYGIVVTLVNGFALGVTSGIGGGLAMGLGLSTLTAWGRWVVLVRIWLPLTGQLPREVNAFLDDAYELGVLRQAGAVYQFRHARLRDRLAEVYEQHERSPAGGTAR